MPRVLVLLLAAIVVAVVVAYLLQLQPSRQAALPHELSLPNAKATDAERASEATDVGDLGLPRADLSEAELAAFNEGKRLFMEKPPYLGPFYNDETCASCHSIPTVGGSGDLEHATYIGPGKDTEVAFYRRQALPGWTVPSRAANIRPRIAPALYGLGLVEQIPDDTIRAACGKGHPSRAKPQQGSLPKNHVARFGYKPFLGTVVDMVGSELLFEHSVTNSLEGIKDHFSMDQDEFADPEVDRPFAETLAAFVRGLRPPPRNSVDPAGEAVFRSFGCAVCHVPDMPPAMGVFSDFCVHGMGEAAADGISDHGAKGDEFRTAPLWGLRFKRLYLRDGRAKSPEEAVLAHEGEAQESADAFRDAPPEQRAALLRFLDTL